MAALLLGAVLSTGPVWSDDTLVVQGTVGRSEFAPTPDGKGQVEVLALAAELPDHLLSVPVGGQISVSDFPVALGELRGVTFERVDVYAPGAKIFRIDRGRLTELPRSNWLFFVGNGADDESVRAVVWIDPKTRALGGTMVSWKGNSELRSAPDSKYVVTPAASAESGANFLCGQEKEETPQLLASVPPLEAISQAISSLHTATIAVDTDNEFMLNKFSNNTTLATNYIASLFAAMNIMYERDLLVRLVQGTTFLRPSTGGPDPYSQTNAANTPPTGSQLGEFVNYWTVTCGTTCANVNRALVTLLSGKQQGTNVAAGIARLGVLCSTANGYSFIEPVSTGSTLSSIDAPVAGHEIGHNFGSQHSHCYQSSPGVWLDGCYTTEGGCFNGQAFCPTPQTYNGVANVTGTVMSYCNPFFIAGCSTSSVFHPYIIANVLQPNIQAAVGRCVFPLVSAPTVASVTPNSGPTAGGTSITITGTNFVSGAAVMVGGSAATGVVFVNGSTLKAVTPAGSGVQPVKVTNPDASSGTLASGFFYANPSAGVSFFTLTPCRLVDTRNPNGALAGPALGASSTRTFTLAGVCGVPSAAKALSLNVTSTGATANGALALYPGNAFPLGTSSVNFARGKDRANNLVIELATNGAGSLGVQNSSAGTVNVIIDVNGYFQ